MSAALDHGRSAADLLRSVGLAVDGPAVWGTPVRSERPGVLIVELAAPAGQAAPIDASLVGKWIEQVPSLMVDGRRPTSRELVLRLASFWIPGTSVLYVGVAPSSIGKRVRSIQATPLGARRPFPGANWLQVLRPGTPMRVWWAETPAGEEYADAVLGAFAAAVPADAVARLPDSSVVLPFANRESATGVRKVHGISGSLLADEASPIPPPAVVRTIPEEPADRLVGAPRARAVPADRPRTTPARRPPAPRAPRAPRAKAGSSSRPAPEPTYLSADGLVQLEAELDELRTIRRPEVIGRVKTARELGDLRENADYEAARKEQSFVEGRIQQLEARLNSVALIEEPAAGGSVGLGSTVIVEVEGEIETYAVVGPHEAAPAEGRISHVSPIGRALMGRRAGDAAVAVTPRGEAHYRILEVR